MQLWDEMGKPNVNATKHPVNDQTDEPIDQINKPQPHIQNNYPLEQQEILNNQSDNPPQHKETPNDQSVNPPEHKETTPNDQNVNPSEQKDTRRKFKPNDDSNKLPLKFAIL
ncbi:hypothetical protein O0L34_g13593 [Tuta absoluta]|nr:hypothetical protein O0L34_g13593 [Tuta absoluta]